MESNHNYILAGHGGMKKTYARIARTYYWPNMQEDINEFCNRCHLCLRKKDEHTKKAPLHPLIAEYPFDKIFMDLVGPLPISQGNAYIIVFICAMTKWIEAFPIRTPDAEDAARAFLKE